jgi:hypothetical protein
VSDQTRRAFVRRSAGAAVSATVIGALVAGEADAAPAEPLVAYVHHDRVSVMAGEREVTIRDRKLAAQIARAAK